MIEPMTHVAVASKLEDREAVVDWLYKAQEFHVMSTNPQELAAVAGEEGDELKSYFHAAPDQSAAIDTKLTPMQSIVNFCNEFRSDKPGFLDSMFPVKEVGTMEDIKKAVEECDIDQLKTDTNLLRSELEKALETLSHWTQHRDLLTQFAFLGNELPNLQKMQHFKYAVVFVNSPAGKAFLLDKRIAAGNVLCELLFEEGTASYYALIVAKDEAAELKSLIEDHGLNVQTLPAAPNGIPAELRSTNEKIAAAQKEVAVTQKAATSYADKWRHLVELANGYYESEKNRLLLQAEMATSEHLFVTRGYVRSKNLELLQLKLENAHPGATMFACECPVADETPPTSLKWPKWLQPTSLLVKMYGLPEYKSIDPTIFVATIFYAFVGICLGDVGYSLLLWLAANFLKKRYKDQPHLVEFFQVFTYCAYSGMFFGVLMGSFCGDLPSILFGDIPVLIDPIKQAPIALFAAITIGLLTQFYGLGVLIYRNLKQGDKMAAFADGFLWILLFASLILGGLVSGVFFYLTALAAILLILTQGREQKGIFAKLGVGVVSLYGIVGSYGASAFLGDVVSYARLMALAMTTAALGSTFNLLVGMVSEIPLIGGVFALLVFIFGHLLNFALGILSAFVHSARLVMLEFFGRFYEAGGYHFKPYGFSSSNIIVNQAAIEQE